jgi:hypothetical protein
MYALTNTSITDRIFLNIFITFFVKKLNLVFQIYFTYSCKINLNAADIYIACRFLTDFSGHEE